jgi:hypothetical protein
VHGDTRGLSQTFPKDDFGGRLVLPAGVPAAAFSPEKGKAPLELAERSWGRKPNSKLEGDLQGKLSSAGTATAEEGVADANVASSRDRQE